VRAPMLNFGSGFSFFAGFCAGAGATMAESYAGGAEGTASVHWGEARRDGRFGFGLVGGRTAAVSKGFHTVGWVMCAMAMYTGAVGEGQPPECLRKRRQAPTSLRRCRPRFPSVRRSPIIRSRTLRRLLDGLSCCCPDGRVEDMSASHQELHSDSGAQRRGRTLDKDRLHVIVCSASRPLV
jgi:hypothetical protein